MAMTIKNADLEFLIHLEDVLYKANGNAWSEDLTNLINFNERLLTQRDKDRETAKVKMAERRKDPVERAKHNKQSRESYHRNKEVK